MKIPGNAKLPAALWWVLGASFLLRLLLALSNLHTLLVLNVPDDAFYYFKIAENIASGRGSTFDGLHATNGYHPLWMGLLIPLFRALPGHPELAANLALVQQAFLDIVTALFVYQLAQAILSDRRWAVLACALYAFNPNTIFYQIDGMETALSTLMAVVVLYLYLPLQNQSTGTLIERVRFAMACGLMLLSRTDNVFLCAVLFCALAAREWREHGSLRKTFGMGLIVAAVVAPWQVWSYARFHQFVQVSGLARPWVVRHNMEGSPIYPSLKLLTRELTVEWPGLSCLGWGYFILLGISWLLLRRPNTKPDAPEKGLEVLSLGWLALFLATAFHCFVRLYPRPWYSALFLALNPLAICWAGKRISKLPWARGGMALALGIIFAAYVVVGRDTIRIKKYPWQTEFAWAAEWINTHTDPAARIGAFNAGIIGFLSRRTVVNLDGAVNNSAYDALRARRLQDYLLANSIDYVADFRYSVEFDYRKFWRAGKDQPELAPVASFPPNPIEWEKSHLQIYKGAEPRPVPTGK